MSNLSQKINGLVQVQFSQLQTQLLEAGLDAVKVNEVFANFSGGSSQVKTTQKKRTKRPQDEKVHIILNYGKSHAVFGDFNGSLVHIKDDYFKSLNWIKYNGALAYGPGWNLIKKDKLSDLETIFKKENVKYVKMSRDKFDKIYRAAMGKKDETPENSDSEEEEGPSEPKGNSGEPPEEEPKGNSGEPPEPPKPKEKTVGRINSWGNRVENGTGFIFHQVLHKKWVAVGTQDQEAKKLSKKVLTKVKREYKTHSRAKTPHVSNNFGLKSIIRLTPDEEKKCQEYHWNYLSSEVVEQVEDEEKAELLQKILDQTSEIYLHLLWAPYKDEDDDDGDEEQGIEIPAEFESKKHFETLRTNKFDTLDGGINDYLSNYYDGNLTYNGGVIGIGKLEELPEDEDGELMAPLVVKEE